MTNKPFLHLIADYGTGDLAFAEVVQKLTHLLPQATILPTSVPPFSTLNTGFIIYQLGLNQLPPNPFIYSNTAPRKDDPKVRQKNAGELLTYARLKNDLQVIAVNAGYTFSFIKPFIKDFCLINVANRGSQFRSRDFFPQAVAGIVSGQTSFLGAKASRTSIPSIPDYCILHIDGYGNIKTTIRHSTVNLKPGEKIRLIIDGNVRTGIYADGSFSVKSGDLAFAPGSSGFDDPFMEIFLRSGSAHKLFFKPQVESLIQIERF